MDPYTALSVTDLFKGNTYPGRGIIIGMTPDAKNACAAYFIMGRSPNSRNRVFAQYGDVLKTEPFDVSKAGDTSLTIYAAIRSFSNRLIITNGDQTDTVLEGLRAGKSFSESLLTRCFEPDAPHFTPRISGMLTFEDTGFSYEMSILKSADAAGSVCTRHTFSYPALPGIGHCIHTYVRDGAPLPSFTGEPRRVMMRNDPDAFTEELWNALDENNRVSLHVRYTDLSDGSILTRTVNRNRRVQYAGV